MASKWYKVGNKTELESSGLIEQSETFFLEGIGPKTFYFFQGNELGVMVDDSYMLIGERDEDITVRDNRALWLDSETQDLWVGFEDGT